MNQANPIDGMTNLLRSHLPICFFCIMYHLLTPKEAFSLQWTVASVAGVMQQPASHYYHAIYGAQGALESDSSRIVLRLGAFERPVFSNQGYEDQDLGSYGLVGSKLTQSKRHGLYAFIGPGQIHGYTTTTSLETNDSRRYKLRGSLFAMEYQVSISSFDLCLNHMQFIGSFDNDQLGSYVAWPFSFYLVSLGYRWF